MVTSDDMKTGLVLLTSAKKPKPGFTLTIIDSSNYNGENKSQSFAPFRYPRALPSDFVKEHGNASKFVTAHEAVLKQILTEVRKVPSIKIIHKREAETPKDEEIWT
jgi:hypothetical protein